MIQRLNSCIILFFVAFVFSRIVLAQNAISIAAGTGTRGVDAYRVNLQHAWAVCLANNYKMHGYFELAGMHLNSGQTFSIPNNSNADVVSLSAVIRFLPKMCWQFYIDLGIGGAYFTKDEIATRNLGSHLLFEDRFGVGVLLGNKQQFEIGYRALHYSNAYLAQVNQSLNLHLFLLGFWF